MFVVFLLSTSARGLQQLEANARLIKAEAHERVKKHSWTAWVAGRGNFATITHVFLGSSTLGASTHSRHQYNKQDYMHSRDSLPKYLYSAEAARIHRVLKMMDTTGARAATAQNRSHLGGHTFAPKRARRRSLRRAPPSKFHTSDLLRRDQSQSSIQTCGLLNLFRTASKQSRPPQTV